MALNKKTINAKLIALVDQKIETCQQVIRGLQQSKLGETKSSAGDKFETGRAMMQIEEDKANGQLMKAFILKNTLQQLDLESLHSTIQEGSLVITSAHQYYIAIGLGKVNLDNEEVYCISMDAPFAKVLFGKKAGDVITFNGKQHTILEIN